MSEIDIRALRLALGELATAIIDITNLIDGDPDLEPEVDTGVEDEPHDPSDEHQDVELGWSAEGSQLRLTGSALDQEPSLGATGSSTGSDHLAGWRRPTPVKLDECEEANEHGGDVLDERQGPEDDLEPSLGWTITGHFGDDFGADLERDTDDEEERAI